MILRPRKNKRSWRNRVHAAQTSLRKKPVTLPSGFGLPGSTKEE
jgi:hypothetical protein